MPAEQQQQQWQTGKQHIAKLDNTQQTGMDRWKVHIVATMRLFFSISTGGKTRVIFCVLLPLLLLLFCYLVHISLCSCCSCFNGFRFNEIMQNHFDWRQLLYVVSKLPHPLHQTRLFFALSRSYKKITLGPKATECGVGKCDKKCFIDQSLSASLLPFCQIGSKTIQKFETAQRNEIVIFFLQSRSVSDTCSTREKGTILDNLQYTPLVYERWILVTCSEFSIYKWENPCC